MIDNLIYIYVYVLVDLIKFLELDDWCSKTSCKLATSRLKLMKNKKGVQLNQMKKELAQLLQSGQDQTARIRVWFWFTKFH